MRAAYALVVILSALTMLTIAIASILPAPAHMAEQDFTVGIE